MKRIVQVLNLFKLLILLPYEISRGSKKTAYVKIKHGIVSLWFLN